MILGSSLVLTIYCLLSDVDECTNNNGGCEQLCENKEGSHECKCNSGFTLEGDGKSCKGNNSSHLDIPFHFHSI